MYILCLDLSLNSTGYSIFNKKGKFISKGFISPNSKLDTQNKLKLIADRFISIKKKYKISRVIIEKGFSRFNTVTQQIFRVHGLANYIFYDIDQEYITSKSVRKHVCGMGNIKKKDFFIFIKNKNKKIKFVNDDEADSFALGQAYFIQKGILKI